MEFFPGDPDTVHLRWSNHSVVVNQMFVKCFEKEEFIDVTLDCEGQSIKCHRLILSACSPFLYRILTENNKDDDPKFVIHLNNMKFWELSTLVTFMYYGEVIIRADQLKDLLKAAESLKIKGLNLELDEDAEEDVINNPTRGEIDYVNQDELNLNDNCTESEKKASQVQNVVSGRDSRTASQPPAKKNQDEHRKFLTMKSKSLQKMERQVHGSVLTTQHPSVDEMLMKTPPNAELSLGNPKEIYVEEGPSNMEHEYEATQDDDGAVGDGKEN